LILDDFNKPYLFITKLLAAAIMLTVAGPGRSLAADNVKISGKSATISVLFLR